MKPEENPPKLACPMTSFNSDITYAAEDVGSTVAQPAANALKAAPNPKDSRSATRKKIVNGRISASESRGLTISGKLMDISLRGVGAVLESPIAVNKIHLLECALLLNGSRVFLSARAVSIHCVLVSGKGFRVGWQFEFLNVSAEKIIKKLMD